MTSHVVKVRAFAFGVI
jgi:hypothetical protein